MAGPVYIAEIAPKNIRGTLTSLVGPGIGLGLLTGSLTNIGLSSFDNGWRVSGLLLCLFGSIYVIGIALVPGSPRFVACAYTAIVYMYMYELFCMLVYNTWLRQWVECHLNTRLLICVATYSVSVV